jgi:iron complex outermembrane receptor protein
MTSTSTKIILLPILLFGLITTAFAQTAKVTGTVIDDHQTPVSFATISLLRAKDSSLVKGTLGTDGGTFVLERVAAGAYIVKATAVGYGKGVSQPFTIAAGADAFAVPTITMPSAAQALKTVSVQASRPLIEHQADRTVMNVENSVLAAGNSAMEILQRAPGVSVDKDDNISLKGKQGVTVMINDKLTYLTSAQLATLLRSTDGTTIKSIEVITNPSAKYDASGNSGIINIKLKKNKDAGTNGSLTAGVGYGFKGKDNESLNINHKQGNLNVFATLSHNDNTNQQSIQIKRIITAPAIPTAYFNQYTDLRSTKHNNSYRFGADYDLSPKNTIGFVVNGYSNTENDRIDNPTFIGRSFDRADSSLHTVSTNKQTYKDFAANVNDVWKIDTAGQQINADLDYSRFRNDANAQYMTNFFLPDGSVQHPPAFLGNQTPSVITIRTAKVDYAKPFSKTLKFESGLKFSDVQSDNDLMQTRSATAAYLSTNHFVYDEKVDAGYVNLNKSFKNTSVQLGLRAEYTSSNAVGDSSNVVQTINRHYLNFFPSVFIHRDLGKKNEIGFSYSRRIDRPQYDNLNPFVFNLDPYTYIKGNPYLRPQYTNNFEFSYTYNKQLNVTLGYSRTTDVITEVPGTDPATKISFITNENLQVQNSYNLNVNTPYTVTKWWEGDVNITGFYLGFKSNGLQGANLDRGQLAYQGRTTQTFSFSGFKTELTANYQSPLTYSLYYVKAQYSADAGVSRSFSNKKLNVKLSMSDLFNTLRNDVTSNYQNNNLDIRQKRESRITRLTLTYNFGSNKISSRKHQTGADEEKNRVKGGN